MTTTRNPFAGRTVNSDPMANLHPAGTFLGTILEPAIGNAQSSGALTLRVPVLSDHDASEGRVTRRLYKYYVFSGDGAAYTDAFLASMGIDLGECSDDEWQHVLLQELHQRRVQLNVYRGILAGQAQARVRTLEATNETRAQDRLLRGAVDEFEDDSFDPQAEDEDLELDIRTAVAVA